MYRCIVRWNRLLLYGSVGGCWGEWEVVGIRVHGERGERAQDTLGVRRPILGNMSKENLSQRRDVIHTPHLLKMLAMRSASARRLHLKQVSTAVS